MRATDTAPKPPPIVSALETISILMVAGNLVFGGIRFDSDLFVTLLSLGVVLWLVLKVTRRRSSRARIALTILAVLGFAFAILALAYAGSSTQLSRELSETPAILLVGGVIMFGLSIAQLVLLWHPTTTAWIRSRSGKSAAIAN